MNLDVQIRPATAADVGAINDIYNHYVDHSTCTFAEKHESLDSRRQWFDSHGPSHPIIVATHDGRVVGWGSLSTYNSRCAYRSTVEDSVYISHDLHRRGIGAVLLADLIRRARELKHHTIIAGISADQQPSVAIHARHGFQKVAHLREVGYKFGRWLDVIYMQRML